MLLNFFRSQNTAPSIVAPTNVRRAVQNIGRLPSLPDTAARAIACAKNSSSSLAEFADIIRCDGALAAATLKLANSVLYRVSRPADSLEQAVVRIGLRGCCNLVTSVGMRGIFRGSSEKTTKRCEVLWRHSLFTAILSSRINQSFQLGFNGEEFTAGLLHDLGRIVLAVAIPDIIDQIDCLDFREDFDICRRERDAMEIDHCEIGQKFCAENDIPESIRSCVAYHHAPNITGAYRDLVALVTAADQIANHVQRQHEIAGFSVADSHGCRLLIEQLDSDRRQSLATLLPKLVVQAIHETRASLKCANAI